MKRLAVVFNQHTPYVRARLRATGALLPLTAFTLRDDDEIWEEARTAKDPYTLRALLQEGESPTPGRIIRAVHQALDQEGPEVVVVDGWTRRSSLAALAWCGRQRVPAVLMLDFQSAGRPGGDIGDAVRLRLLRGCSAVLTGGKTHADILVRLGVPREQIRVGYDVVDNAYFTESAAEARRIASSYHKRLDLPRNYLICVGRLEREKNLPRLLDAYAAYRRELGKKAWKLVIAGDGTQYPDLSLRIHQMELRDQVILAGTFNYRVMPAVYGLAQAFVLASTREPWGLAVNEAMASGLPVFVSDRVSCGPELVRNGENGYIFDAQKPGDLTSHLLKATRGEYNLSVMGCASLGLISEWTLERFARRLVEAAEIAQANPATPSRWDRSLTSILARRPGAPN